MGGDRARCKARPVISSDREGEHMNSMMDEQTSKVPEERLIGKFEPYIRALPEDRARFCRELLRRAQGIADRMSAAPVPSDPWLPGPNESAAVRRDAARLRAGIILP